MPDESAATPRPLSMNGAFVHLRCTKAPFMVDGRATLPGPGFFGREALTHSLLDRLDRQRFPAVFGASGEGKSSLLRAGLAAKFPNAVICTPGHDPATRRR